MDFTTTARFNLADIVFPLIDVPVGSTLVLEGGQLRGEGMLLGGTLNHIDGTLSIGTGEFVHNGSAFVLNGGMVSARPVLQLTGGAQATNMSTVTIASTNYASLVIEQGSELVNTSHGMLGDGSDATGTVVIRDPGRH